MLFADLLLLLFVEFGLALELVDLVKLLGTVFELLEEFFGEGVILEMAFEVFLYFLLHICWLVEVDFEFIFIIRHDRYILNTFKLHHLS